MTKAASRQAEAAHKGTSSRELYLADLAATERLAAALARLARVGDVLALAGPLGVGKTAFARAFITALGGEEEVPSPTFTLVQLYELGTLTLYHFDLYRLERPEEAYELGIEEAFAEGVTLIEWPERLGPLLPPERLDLALAFAEESDARCVRLTGHGRWARRLAELKA
ncbi:MAG TPA: tRNA (adenosine(37)-N6)-threonylcarbamoyltransferase complex ATPase subunit type 1 TsaE [Alphaproteobacteria bacterium]|nr:tRNA (adenosine(37)-N6)-threonylcarbamoyltransferase complex ATPase subunit type 1 TsaE [Alphaproteobacteria bacterium]